MGCFSGEYRFYVVILWDSKLQKHICSHISATSMNLSSYLWLNTVGLQCPSHEEHMSQRLWDMSLWWCRASFSELGCIDALVRWFSSRLAATIHAQKLCSCVLKTLTQNRTVLKPWLTEPHPEERREQHSPCDWPQNLAQKRGENSAHPKTVRTSLRRENIAYPVTDTELYPEERREECSPCDWHRSISHSSSTGRLVLTFVF